MAYGKRQKPDNSEQERKETFNKASKRATVWGGIGLAAAILTPLTWPVAIVAAVAGGASVYADKKKSNDTKKNNKGRGGYGRR